MPSNKELTERVEQLEKQVKYLLEILTKGEQNKRCKKCFCKISQFAKNYCNSCAEPCYNSDCGCDYHRGGYDSDSDSD